MKPQYCEKESLVLFAFRAGNLDSELLAHAAECSLCFEVLLVAQSLREESASTELGFALPDAAVVWRQAQTRARQNALAKATLPIRIVRTCALVVSAIALPWLVLELRQQPSWLADLGFARISALQGVWFAALGQTMMLGMAASFAVIGLSSWYVLKRE